MSEFRVETGAAPDFPAGEEMAATGAKPAEPKPGDRTFFEKAAKLTENHTSRLKTEHVMHFVEVMHAGMEAHDGTGLTPDHATLLIRLTNGILSHRDVSQGQKLELAGKVSEFLHDNLTGWVHDSRAMLFIDKYALEDTSEHNDIPNKLRRALRWLGFSIEKGPSEVASEKIRDLIKTRDLIEFVKDPKNQRDILRGNSPEQLGMLLAINSHNPEKFSSLVHRLSPEQISILPAEMRQQAVMARLSGSKAPAETHDELMRLQTALLEITAENGGDNDTARQIFKTPVSAYRFMLLVGPERAREVFDAAHPDANFLEHFAGFSDVTAVSNVMHEHLASRSDQRVGLEAVIGMMTPEEKAEYIKKLTKKNIEFLRLNVDHTIDPTQEALSPAQRGREKFQRAARQAARLGVRASAEGEERIALTPAYVREALDPQHVYGKASMFHEWLESEDNNLSFAEWRQGKIKNSEVHRLRALEVGVTYLSAEEREGHRAEFTRDGRLNITTKDLAHVDMGQGWGLFVLDAEQNLFVGQHDRGTFQHSSFFSGEPIWGAGMVRINESGRITGINMHSGHYRPSGEDTYRTLKFFEAQGIDLSFVSFEFNTQGRRIRGLASIILTRLEAKYGS